MLRDRYEPMTLFAFVPALRLALEPGLAQPDQRLAGDGLFRHVKADLPAGGAHPAEAGGQAPVRVGL